MKQLVKDRYLLAMFLSFILAVFSRYFCVKQYRSEVGYNADESFDVVKNSSSAFFFDDNKTITNNIEVEKEHEHDEHKDFDYDEKVGLKLHVHGPECKHEHDHENHDGHKHGEETGEDSKVSPGLTLMMKQLGFAEMAASFLWIQMDADSHKELWHRVDFELELIPALDPTFIEGYLLRSTVLSYYRNNWEGGIYVIEKALKKIKNRAELWEQLGILCYNRSGRFGKERKMQRALEAFGNLASLKDAPEYAARFYAQSLAILGRREEAIAFMENVVKIDSRSESAKKHDKELIERIKNGDKFVAD